MKPKFGLLALITILATVSTPWQLRTQENTSLISNTSAQAQTTQDRSEEALRLYQLGVQQYNQGQFREALKTFEQVLRIVRAIGDRQGEGTNLNNIGLVYYRLGQYTQALKYYQQALTIHKKVGNKVEEGTNFTNIGLVYKSLGQYTQALKYHQQALTLHKQVGNKAGEGTTLSNIGLVYNSLGQYTQALKYHQQALTIVKQVGDKTGEGATLSYIGRVYYSLGQYTQALKYHQQALTVVKQVGDKTGEGITLNSIGGVYNRLGQYSQALKYFQQALTIHKQVGNKDGEGAILSNIGGVYNRLGQYSQALKYHQQALVIAKQVGDKDGEGKILNHIGLVYDSLGQYTQALKYYQQALVIAKQVGDKAGEGTILNNIGEVYNCLGQYSQAEKALFTAIKILEPLRSGLSDGDKISFFDMQGGIYASLQYALVAQNKTNTALEIAERGRARAFVELLASRLSSQLEDQSTITPPTALQMQQIAKAQNATLIQYSIIRDRIKVQGKEEWSESRLFIWVIPPTGRIIFRWVDLKPLLKQNTSLSELAPNSPSVVPVAPESPTDITTTAKSAPQWMITWSHPGAIALVILSVGSLIGFSIWSVRFILTRTAIQNRKLKHHWLIPCLLFVSAVGSVGGLIFLMTRSQPIAQNRNLTNDSLLSQLIGNTRVSLAENDSFTQQILRGLGIVPKGQKGSQSDRLQQLHQILIEPIADLLPTDPNARIIFIPQSSLFLVPFPALKDEQGKYLIEKHTILTAPSIQTLDLTRKQKQRLRVTDALALQGKNALVVGNPTMPSVPPQIGESPQQLPSLPGAEQEAKAITKLLKTTALTGNQATKQAVLEKMADARIVHLATHGLLDEYRGLGSAIALAPSSQDDGLLTAEQILDLKLNAELVVLSACDTGRGKITGDGVVGLSRSLITAGVPSVLVSLWSVPDAPTASLMIEFYRNLQHNPDKAQALRKAMLTIMKQHPDPRDWAAFTLIGEAE